MPPPEFGVGQDLIDLLVAEHRRLETLFAEVETAPDAAGRRRALAAAVAALAGHTAAEEAFLHPALREHLPAGPEIAAYEASEHARVDELVGQLGGPDGAVGALLDTVRQHIQEEETELFPRLSTACPAGVLDDLGDRLRSARVTE